MNVYSASIVYYHWRRRRLLGDALRILVVDNRGLLHRLWHRPGAALGRLGAWHAVSVADESKVST